MRLTRKKAFSPINYEEESACHTVFSKYLPSAFHIFSSEQQAVQTHFQKNRINFHQTKFSTCYFNSSSFQSLQGDETGKIKSQIWISGCVVKHFKYKDFHRNISTSKNLVTNLEQSWLMSQNETIYSKFLWWHFKRVVYWLLFWFVSDYLFHKISIFTGFLRFRSSKFFQIGTHWIISLHNNHFLSSTVTRIGVSKGTINNQLKIKSILCLKLFFCERLITRLALRVFLISFDKA